MRILSPADVLKRYPNLADNLSSIGAWALLLFGVFGVSIVVRVVVLMFKFFFFGAT